jgi:acetyl-CoA carboxylase carboxyltransferase component
MYRSVLQALDQSWMVTGVLDRWLRDRVALAPTFGDRHRAALSRLVHVMPGRSDRVAELAREVHYRYVDEPLLETAASSADAHVEEWLRELVDGEDGARTSALVQEIVWCPRPMRSRLRDGYIAADRAGRRRVLEARLRRFYRIRELQNVRVVAIDGLDACVADYRYGGGWVHVVSAYVPYDGLRPMLDGLKAHLRRVPADRQVVVDVESWRDEAKDELDALSRDVTAALAGVDAGRALHRLDLTVTSSGAEEEHRRTQHLSFRQQGTGFVEDLRYRGLHPMIAKRLDLGRWQQFALTRLPSAEDVYLFAAVARDNPADSRLVAIAEVRDLTPAQDSTGRATGYPLLERMLSEAFTSIRHAGAQLPSRERPVRNRVVLHVRPTWDVPAGVFREIAHRWAPVSNGLGLEKVQLRVRLPQPGAGGTSDAVIDVTGAADHGVTVLTRPPGDEPVAPLTDYEQKVLKAERAGAPYPYELLRMLTPPPGAPSDFPPGDFVEYDLDATGETLAPVDRLPGGNTCGIVTGVLTTYTATVPEGMARVVLVGDPTRGLGNLAEAECRRINAALDLAERRGVPLEWYALSSGARIAMDSGTENMDWISAVLRRVIEFTQHGGEINVVVTGINVGAQPYWNAEATMLMHTRGVLVMTPASAMVLTGKSSLDYSGGVSAEDNTGIGGFDRVMGPNGQGQYWAPNLAEACALLLRHYDLTYVVPGEDVPRRHPTTDPVDRDVRTAVHRAIEGCDFTTVGDVFSDERNPDRKKPFDMRSVMRAVADADSRPLERWGRWRDAETAIVWDTTVGGIPVCLLGIESRPLPRSRFVPADGPPSWTSGTLFPQSSRKLARAINAASGNRPLVVLANLSGFDGSPESMRGWQLEYGAEIGRAVTNFRGPIVFVVVSRYHGGAFVVFSKKLNEDMEIAAVEGSYASVIGGAPAAAVVFAREVNSRTERDPRVVEQRAAMTEAAADDQPALRRALSDLVSRVRAQKLKEVADEFDAIHDIRRAQRVGSVDLIVPARELRPYVIGALERGLTRRASRHDRDGEGATARLPR